MFRSLELGEDLLTCALQNGEHSGRVRGIGSYVTPTAYFKYPKQGRRSAKHDHAAELVEAKKEISDQK